MTLHQRTKEKRQEQEAMVRMEALLNDGTVKRYKINEIFYSIQGEGDETGCAAVFIRFSACNLACAWCDTEYDTGGKLSIETILRAVKGRFDRPDIWMGPKPIIICTGGEPSLQMDEGFVDAFQDAGYKLSMETNGILWKPAMQYFQTVVVSPKTLKGWWSERSTIGFPRWRERRMVLKVVYDRSNPLLSEIMKRALATTARAHYLQPLECQTSKETNAAEVIKIVKNNPRWRLSLQTHKILNVR